MSKRRKREALKIVFDKSQFSAMISALHELVEVFAAAQVKPTFSDTAQNARFLRTFGLSQRKIGGVLGMTHQAVDEALKKKPPLGRRKGR